MNYIISYENFSVYESYLESNFAPLYHYTAPFEFIEIIKTNTLNVGFYDNIFNKKKIKILSLSRSKKLNFDYYKPFKDVIIELKTHKLRENYKIYKYDFFIHRGIEIYTKSIPTRIQPFEFEEIILTDVHNIIDYISSITFKNNSIKLIDENTLNVLNQNNINLYDEK